MSTDFFDGFANLFEDEVRVQIMQDINTFFKDFGTRLTKLQNNNKSIGDVIHCLEAIETIADPKHNNQELFNKQLPVLVHEASKKMHAAPNEINEAAKYLQESISKEDLEYIKLFMSKLMFKLRKLISKLEEHTPPATWYRNKKGFSISERIAQNATNYAKNLAKDHRKLAVNRPITPIMDQGRQSTATLASQAQISANDWSIKDLISTNEACRCVVS